MRGRVAGGDLLDHVIHPDALTPGQVSPDPAVQRSLVREAGALGQVAGEPPRDHLGRVAVLADQPPAAQHLLALRQAEQRRDPRGWHGQADGHQLARLAGLVPVQLRRLPGVPK